MRGLLNYLRAYPVYPIAIVLTVFTVVLVAWTGVAESSERHSSIQFLCCSVHHRENKNGVHLGLFYERQVSDQWRVVAGTFQNSLNVRSYVLGVQREWSLSEDWDALLTVGVATGYNVSLAAVPALEFRDRVRLYVIPGVVYAVGFEVLRW